MRKKASDNRPFTVYPRLSVNDAHSELRKKYANKSESSNTYWEKFLAIVENVLQNLPTFSEIDIINTAKTFDIPDDRLKQMFAIWSKKMIQIGRLEQIDGCYNYPVFLRI